MRSLIASALATTMLAAAPTIRLPTTDPTTQLPITTAPAATTPAAAPANPVCIAGQAKITTVQTSVTTATTEARRVMAMTVQPQTDAKLCAAELSVRAAVKKAQALKYDVCFASKPAFDAFQANLTHILDGAEKVIVAYKCGH